MDRFGSSKLRIGWALEAAAGGGALRERERALAALDKALPANRAERLLQGAALATEEPGQRMPTRRVSHQSSGT